MHGKFMENHVNVWLNENRMVGIFFPETKPLSHTVKHTSFGITPRNKGDLRSAMTSGGIVFQL